VRRWVVYRTKGVLFLISVLLAAVHFLPASSQIDSRELCEITAENAKDLTQIGMFGHGRVTDMAWSPDGSVLVVATTAGIWSYTADHFEHPPRLFEGHSSQVNAVDFSPSGQMLASASSDGTVRLWDVPAGKLATVLELDSSVHAVKFSPDGRNLATMAGRYTETGPSYLQLWDIKTGELSLTLSEDQEHGYGAATLAFNSDGKILAVARTNTIDLCDTTTGRRVSGLEHSAAVTGIAFIPRTPLLVSTDVGGFMNVWNFETGDIEQSLEIQDHLNGVAVVSSSLIVTSRNGNTNDIITLSMSYSRTMPG